MVDEIAYTEMLKRFARFLANPAAVIDNPTAYANWLDYLNNVRDIESTIPTYESYDGKADDHSLWLGRTFWFIRSFLEERETKESNFGKKTHLAYYKPNETKHDFFHRGAGISAADLVDEETNERYDVKHNSGDFSKAHDAEYVIKFQPDGVCTIHSRAKLAAGQGSCCGFFECRSLAELATAEGLPADIFTKSDAELKQLFAYKE